MSWLGDMWNTLPPERRRVSYQIDAEDVEMLADIADERCGCGACVNLPAVLTRVLSGPVHRSVVPVPAAVGTGDRTVA